MVSFDGSYEAMRAEYEATRVEPSPESPPLPYRTCGCQCHDNVMPRGRRAPWGAVLLGVLAGASLTSVIVGVATACWTDNIGVAPGPSRTDKSEARIAWSSSGGEIPLYFGSEPVTWQSLDSSSTATLQLGNTTGAWTLQGTGGPTQRATNTMRLDPKTGTACDITSVCRTP